MLSRPVLRVVSLLTLIAFPPMVCLFAGCRNLDAPGATGGSGVSGSPAGATEVDLPIRAAIEGAEHACAGSDGTVAVWGTAQAGNRSLQCLMVLERDVWEWRSLVVPDGVVLNEGGGMLDLDRDGRLDLVVFGERSSKDHVAMIWLDCEAGASPAISALQFESTMMVAAGSEVYACDGAGR